MMQDEEYDYSHSGFDGFLSRGMGDVAMSNLDSQGPVSRQVAYDRNQTTGMLGDTLRIGSIHLDGVSGAIDIYDGENVVVRVGKLDV